MSSVFLLGSRVEGIESLADSDFIGPSEHHLLGTWVTLAGNKGVCTENREAGSATGSDTTLGSADILEYWLREGREGKSLGIPIVRLEDI